MIAVLLLCGLSGCKDGQGFDSDTPSVAIIIKGSESDFWNDVKKGALSAATEFNIDITFEGPDNEEDYETQNKMIDNAVSSISSQALTGDLEVIICEINFCLFSKVCHR